MLLDHRFSSRAPLRTAATLVLLLAASTALRSPVVVDAAPQAEGDHSGAASEPPPSSVAPTRSRFFLAGAGVLDLKNFHTGEEQRVRFRNPDGTYSADALERLMTLFRSRGDDRTTEVSLRLFELLDYLQDRFKPNAMLLMSGYRSPEYNAQIRAQGAQAARSSLHTEGLAADVRFLGLDQHAVWLAIRDLGCCGVGYYKTGQFLHVDVGRPRFWEETTSRVSENLSAGNARVFARTDYDRYDSLPGAVVSLHAVTLHPLRVARRAELLAEEGGESREVVLGPVGETPAVEADCFVLADAPAIPPHRFEVLEVAGKPGPRSGRSRIVLHTCAERLEATPERIESNPIEVRGAEPPRASRRLQNAPPPGNVGRRTQG